MVRPRGFEPRSCPGPGLPGYKPVALPLSYGRVGQRGRLRSCGLLLPKQALSQTELHAVATCRGFDPRSSARQADRHTSSVAGLKICLLRQGFGGHPAKRVARSRMVSAGRLERPLSALSTRSLCRLGYADEMPSSAKASEGILLRASRNYKSCEARSAKQDGEPRRARTSCGGVKSPVPGRSRLYARGP